MKVTFNKLLIKLTALYSQGWHRFAYDGEAYTITETSKSDGTTIGKPFIVILGRKHYKEWSKEYKAPTSAALKKIVKLELAAKSESHIHFEVHKPIEGVFKVTFWQPEAEVVAKLPSSVRWVIPESYLIAQPDTIVAAKTPSGTLYVAQQIGVSSSSDTLGCRNTEHFQWMSGVSHSASQQALDLHQYTQALVQALRAKLLRLLSQFSFQKAQDYSELKRQLKPAIIMSLSLVAVYMAASSLYLNWHHQSLLESYQAKSQQINQVLSTQQTIQQQLQTLKQGEESLSGLKLSSPVWLVVLSQLELDIRFTQINYDDGLVVLRGNAASATELLTHLIQHPLVQDAKFITAVSRQRNRDRFSISFQLNNNGDWQSLEQQKNESVATQPEGESS